MLGGNTLFTYDGEARGVIPVVFISILSSFTIILHDLRKCRSGNSSSQYFTAADTPHGRVLIRLEGGARACDSSYITLFFLSRDYIVLPGCRGRVG